MIEKLPNNKATDLSMEACSWIAQLETGKLTAQDLSAFREWMSRSPAHQKEIRRLAYLSQDINVLTDMAPSLTAAADKHRQLIKKPSRYYWLPKVSFAASILFAVVLFTSNVFTTENSANIHTPILYSTAIGDHRQVELSDGTLVELNTNSEIEVDYSAARRKVRLLRGEAFFKVAHNANRPFLVYAGEKSVRAVGTAFLVRHLEKQFEVTVTEGRIELANMPVSSNNQTKQKSKLTLVNPTTENIFLDAGESVIVIGTITKVIDSLSKSEIVRKLSWQEGLLEFSDTPLKEVIDDLSRYTSVKIKIVDQELSELKFGGLFRISELDSLFDALESNFNILIEYDDNGTLLLKKAPQ